MNNRVLPRHIFEYESLHSIIHQIVKKNENKKLVTANTLKNKRSIKMKTNVGRADKLFRIILGVAAIAVGIYFKSWWGAIGVIPLATGLINWCPLYMPFGISTCRTEAKHASH